MNAKPEVHKETVSLKNVSSWKFRSKLEISLIILSIALFLINLSLLISLIYSVLKPSICISPACIKAASKLLETLDDSKDPCTDFYNFACGTYLKTAYEDSKTGEVYMLGSKAKRQYEAMFREPLHTNDSRYYRNLKILYNSCVNETEINEHGLGYLKNVLDELGGWPIVSGLKWNDKGFNWKNMTVKLRKLGYFYNIFVSFHIFEDVEVTKQHYLKLDCPLVKEIGTKSDFENYLTSIAILFGAPKQHASHESKRIYEFAAEFLKANYILWETVKEMIVFLPTEFQERSFESSKNIFWETSKYTTTPHPSVFRARSGSPRNSLSKAANVTKPVKLPRSTICEREVQKLLPSVADRVYAEKYAPPETRKLVVDVVRLIKQEFKTILSHNKWMDANTKKYALEKLEDMKQFVGGNFIDTTPEEIEKQMVYAYVNLDDEPNYFSILAKCRNVTHNYYFTIINKTSEEVQILSLYQFVSEFNAFYSSSNAIVVPAALFQDMLFDKGFPNYLNYGGFGHLIGHEITHAFTKMASKYGRHGEEFDWWTNATKDNYNNVTSCLVSMYEDYTEKTIGLKLNGTSTLDENIADLTGTLVAYELYNKLSANDAKLIGFEQYTPRQLFWISTARFYCDPQESHMKYEDTTDVHSISSFRIIGTFGNIPYFAQDFNCPLGSQMNPTHKCEIF